MFPKRIYSLFTGKKSPYVLNSLYATTKLISQGNVSAVQGPDQKHIDKIAEKFSKYFSCDPKQILFSNSGGTSLQVTIRALQGSIGNFCHISNNTCTAAFQSVLATASIPLFTELCPTRLELKTNATEINSLTSLEEITVVTNFAGKRDSLCAHASNRWIIEDSCLYFPPSPLNQCDEGPLLQIFSFGFNKPISVGEGSLIISRDLDLALEIKQLLNWGETKKSDHKDIEKPSWNGRYPAYSLAFAASLLNQHVQYNNLAKLKLFSLLCTLEKIGFPVSYPKISDIPSLDLSRNFSIFFNDLNDSAALKNSLITQGIRVESPIFENLNNMDFIQNRKYRSWLNCRDEALQKAEANYFKKFATRNELIDQSVTISTSDLIPKRGFKAIVRSFERIIK